MESIKFVKGYGKLDLSEQSNSPPNNNRRRKIIAISLAVFLTLAIGSLIAAVIHESATESEQSESSALSSNSAQSLKTVCAVTRYPDSCFSSISSLNTQPTDNSPLRFFNLSLTAGQIEVSHLKTLLNDSNAVPAMKDCAELFDDSLSQLNRSAELLRVGRGEKVLTEMTISDIKTWVSAAMTDQETCLDGLAETGSTALGEFKVRVQKSQEYMSNTLAILNNIQSLFDKFGLKMP